LLVDITPYVKRHERAMARHWRAVRIHEREWKEIEECWQRRDEWRRQSHAQREIDRQEAAERGRQLDKMIAELFQQLGVK